MTTKETRVALLALEQDAYEMIAETLLDGIAPEDRGKAFETMADDPVKLAALERILRPIEEAKASPFAQAAAETPPASTLREESQEEAAAVDLAESAAKESEPARTRDEELAATLWPDQK